jgi:hypothetical protein
MKTESVKVKVIGRSWRKLLALMVGESKWFHQWFRLSERANGRRTRAITIGTTG